jgi:hypothetical protein
LWKLKIYGFDHEGIRHATCLNLAKQNMCFFVEKRLAVNALNGLMTTLGWGFQQFSSSSCDNNFQGIKCNCGSTVCHVTGL